MLKRIGAQQARSGMFVEAIEGAWDESDLQQRRFLLTPEIARKLKASAVNSVVINTTKGVDVLPGSSGGASSTKGEGTECARSEAAAASQVAQNSAFLLGEQLNAAATHGTIHFAETAVIADEIGKSIDRNPSMFLSVTRLKSKDQATFDHSVAVSGLMIHFGRYLGLDAPTVQLLGAAGLLHDIGKIRVPGVILNKPGKLDEEEMRLMRDHPRWGHQMLSAQSEMPEIVLDICLHHHERIDGRGYPDKLSGANLSVYARLAAICDVYDAVTSVRPYKKPWSAAEALSWMAQRHGHFDEKLLRKFALCLS